MGDVYERLAQYLDELPAGYPATPSGVQVRILRKLFSEQEAGLFLHLTLIGEEARVVAYRAGLPLEIVEPVLEEMERKGLLYCKRAPGQPPEYSALQFVVGLWELQVNRLDRELVELFEEYAPVLMNPEQWRKAPQLRTIPIGESIPAQAGALPYERAEEIIRGQSAISVANCICRQELRIAGEGCDKPPETCLAFGSSAHYYARTGRGRMISQEEALAILRLADQAGLVLQPSNAKDPTSICACCGCCCGVLRSLKRHPQPASIASSPYIAFHDPALCSSCGTCIDRCQMEAMVEGHDGVFLDAGRCIGCGLCVSTCPNGALELRRKPDVEQPVVPNDMLGAYVLLGQSRGKLSKRDLVGMLAKSKSDRLEALH